MRRPLVFVCSPFASDIPGNTELAKKLCLLALRAGYAPWAPHLLYPQIITEKERALGIACGCAWLAQADEVWVWAWGPKDCSSGMQVELERAAAFSIPPKVVFMPKAWQALAKERGFRKTSEAADEIISQIPDIVRLHGGDS